MVSKPGRSRWVEALLFCVILAALVGAANFPLISDRPGEAYIAQVGVFASVVALLTAVASRRGMQAGSRFAELAYRDELTGLSNRRHFLDQLASVLGSYKGKEPFPALLLLDLDRFKLINDTLGHPAGDELLVCVAARLQDAVPKQSELARLGGDEFAVLIKVERESDAVTTADAILARLNEPVLIQDQEIWPSASAGIAVPGPLRLPPAELLRIADVALYQAKLRGKGQAFLFRPDARLPSPRRLSLEAELHAGLQRHEFEMVYQPVVSLKDSRIVGAEALVRWNHPSQGVLAPDSFLNLADETGLSRTLCNWIVMDACAQAESWEDLFGDELPVSINLTALQFQAMESIPEMRRLLQGQGAPRQRVNFEITEAALLRDDEAARHNLEALRRLGFKVAIDDFGLGYSSLSYLQSHPVDILKLDGSLVRGNGSPDQTREVLRCVVELAHSLGMTVTAEGIETEEEYRNVLDAGCDLGQGYYFAAPMPAQQLTDMIAGGQRVLPQERPVSVNKLRRRGSRVGKAPWDSGFAERWGA